MSLHQVEVSRKEILEIVKQNKQKHDKILSDAIDGFWIDAEKTLKRIKEEKLKEFKKNYQKQVKELKKQISKEFTSIVNKKKDSSFQYMRNPYPENHTEDYITVIRKLELSVEDTVKLDDNEFNQYVRNKWSWRESFLNTNTYYTNVVSGSTVVPHNSITGSWCSTAAADINYCLTSSYAVSYPKNNDLYPPIGYTNNQNTIDF